MPNKSPHVQKVKSTTLIAVSTFLVLLFAGITFVLNESIYVNNDPAILIAGTAGDCKYHSLNEHNHAVFTPADFNGADDATREMLYSWTFSARGSSIAVVALGVVALILGLTKQHSVYKYKDGDEKREFVFQWLTLAVAGAVLAAILVTLTTLISLSYQGAIPSGVDIDRKLCETGGDMGENIPDRLLKLRISLVLSLFTLPCIMYMARELHDYQKEEEEVGEDGQPLLKV